MLITDKEALQRYQDRKWQGIPGIERTKKGRLFATFYSGGEGEGVGNFAVLLKSEDDGRNWSDLIAVSDPKEDKRAFDPCLFIDPKGRLWWFWAESTGRLFDGKCGVWCVRCDDPDADTLVWTVPRRIANGIMMNKPTVLKNGDWLLPCAVWNVEAYKDLPPTEAENEKKSNVYISRDEGESFLLYGQADVPNRAFDEHMTLELANGDLWMLVRTKYGIGKSVSHDGGKTWTPGEDSGLGGPDSRFFIRRLPSGRILLVNHYQFTGRDHMTAMLSEDECKTWKGFLLLDERDKVSYPDAAFDSDGNFYIIYDRDRRGAGEILMAKVTEEDILAGQLVNPDSRLKQIVSRL
ncbi:MAG TPA: sialidase family protein [Clostridiales bacterium]|nr:sialidase family protein [Clostridiales bacterium]